MPIQVADRWREKFGMPINEGYGLTETSPFASYNHALKFVPGSIGTPIDLARIIDIKKPNTRVYYDLQEIGSPNLEGILSAFISEHDLA
mgnify:CR=1 FL=1